MDKYLYTEKCTLLVSTSDDYESTWYPYFELLKIFWKNHPHKIVLNSETKGYYDAALNIESILGGRKTPWGERLYNCLEKIETEYIIFSLEDFFLLGYVNDAILEECVQWMEENSDIAVCRLKASNEKSLVVPYKNSSFRIAGNDTPYRLDTQVSIWRRSDLMSFIDREEDPWHFEEVGTKRIANSEKIFLWHYQEDERAINESPFPYSIFQAYGYGVAWGRWLWNNKKWFKKNNIFGVKYHYLGILPRWAVKLRFKYLYRAGKQPVKGFAKIIQKIYRKVDQIEKALIQIRLYGWREGLGRIKEKRRK